MTGLSGGITNRNFLVTAGGTTDRWVIRLAGNDTHLLGISREVEHAATVAAAGVGVGPEVTAFIRPEGYLVTRFIEGAPVTDEAVHRPETLRRVADSLRRIHDGPAIPGLFVPLRIVEAYRALAMERGVRSRSSTSWRPRSAGGSSSPAWPPRSSSGRATTTCSTRTSSTTASRIRIVDWEYAGMGDPFFDLGNFSINHELTPTRTRSSSRRTTARSGPGPGSATLMRVVSDFREAMWGVLQQGISTLDVDFVAYAGEHFDRLLANAATPRFEHALGGNRRLR